MELIDKYIELCFLHGELQQQGDSEKSNNVHSQITNLVNEIRASNKNTVNLFYKLLDHENASVSLWTAAKLLGTFEEKSVATLQRVGSNPKIIGLSANALLKLWEDGMHQVENWEIAST
ncbi:hypothetical protein [Lutimonas sp.]|uniref:hypothetical protein n=1 Tax=Lutimonas sp. TaxID=1872403 RepID=UPI003D9B4872